MKTCSTFNRPITKDKTPNLGTNLNWHLNKKKTKNKIKTQIKTRSSVLANLFKPLKEKQIVPKALNAEVSEWRDCSVDHSKGRGSSDSAAFLCGRIFAAADTLFLFFLRLCFNFPCKPTSFSFGISLFFTRVSSKQHNHTNKATSAMRRSSSSFLACAASRRASFLR
jgi:hypothetical protein